MKKLLAVISGLALLACTSPAWSAPVDAFKDLKGSLDIAGGTAHIPVMKAAAKAIMEANPNIHITVAGGGSGVGVQKVECMEEVLSVAYGERVRRKCDVCGKEMEVAELLEVVKAPRVVVMVTERSEKPQRRSVFYRIRWVNGPCVKRRGERKEVYDLYGVVCQPRRGIEKAFCVLRVNRSWYKFQDEKVFIVTECYLDLVEP